MKNRFTGKDPDAGKDWRQEEKGKTEDEMLDNITDSMDTSVSKFQETVKVREAWCAAVHAREGASHQSNNDKTKKWSKSVRETMCVTPNLSEP